MAIQKTILGERFNINIPNAYIKLVHVRWSDIDGKVIATFSVWASEAARLADGEAIDTIEIDATAGFPNIEGTLYTRIKALARFSGAVDV